MVRAILAASALALFSLVSVTASSTVTADETKPIDLENTICPVKKQPVKAGVTETVNGAVVHFCCTMCAEKYKANPAAYESTLRADPDVSKRLDLARQNASGGDAPGGMAASPAPGAPASPPPGGAPMPDAPARAPANASKAMSLHDGMRRLWEDHVWWTRLFIVSATSDLPDKEAATQRLLRNQDDIGNAIKPFYGDEAGTKLTGLLRDHIMVAAKLVGALKANDSAAAGDLSKKWSANADEIATFLSGANPGVWPIDATKTMMREHLEATTAEVKARLEKNWSADIDAFDKVHDQALHMADTLSDGIAKQFPQKVQ